jgi:phosphoribosylamine--glycine ligase
LLAAARGALPSAVGPRSEVVPGAAVGIVQAVAGYPAAPRTGASIAGLDVAAGTGALVFHAGTARTATGAYRTAGGRVVTIVGRGPDLGAARDAAERAADAVTFEGSQRRHDIAAEILIPCGAR